MNQELLGHTFGVYVPVPNGSGSTVPTLVAASRSIDHEETTEAVDASHADTFPAPNKLYGQEDGTLDLENVHLVDAETGGLDASHQALIGARREREEITVIIGTPSGGQTRVPMVITSVSISMPYSEVTANSISLKHSGAIGVLAGLRFRGDGTSYEPGVWTSTSGTSLTARNDTAGEQPALDESGSFPVLDFDGSTDRLLLEASVLETLFLGFTIAGAARIDSAKNHTIIGGGEDGGPSEIDLDTQDGSDRLSLRIGTAPVISSPPGSITIGEWFVFLFRFEPGAGRGLVVGEEAVSDDTGDIGWEQGGAYYVGAETDASYLDGAIAELLVYGRAIPPGLQDRVLARLRETYL